MLPRFSTLFGFGCCLLARAAWADTSAPEQAFREHGCDKGIASQHFDAATRLLEDGKRREAIAAFEAAYACHPHFAVLYNISQAYVQLRDFAAARKYLERYLEEGNGQIDAEQLGAAREQRRLLQEAVEGATDVPQHPEAPGSVKPEASPGSLRVKERRDEVVTSPLEAAEPGELPEAGSSPTKIPVLSYALGGLGVVIAGAALGVHAWNQGRFEDWKDADAELVAAREAPWSAGEASLWNERQRINNRLWGSIEATHTTVLGLSLGAALAASGAVYFALADASPQVSLRADGVALHLVW